jgi:hypothetical protein
MLPFFVSCLEPASKLYQLNDGRFQMIDQDGIAPLMYGCGYILMEAPLADFIKAIGVERVGIEPAIIFDRRQNKEYHTHQSVKVGQSFSSSEINDLNLDGDRLLFMGNEYLFVSPSLKSKLANGPFKYLEFSEGLYGFAGSRA